MLKYKPISDLLVEVENNLYSYYQSATIDNAGLYPLVQRKLEKIGVKILPKKALSVQVENYKAKLPNDYVSLIVAFACKTEFFKTPTQQGGISYEKRICEVEACKSECDYCHDEKGRYQVIQRHEVDIFKHTDLQLLVSKEFAGNECINPVSKGKYDMEISGGYIHTQFREGNIFLEYRGLLEQDNDLLIPDYAEITEWLIMECEKYQIKRMAMNGDDSKAASLLQYADKELYIAEENARSFYRRHELTEYNKLKQFANLEFKRLSFS